MNNASIINANIMNNNTFRSTKSTSSSSFFDIFFTGNFFQNGLVFCNELLVFGVGVRIFNYFSHFIASQCGTTIVACLFHDFRPVDSHFDQNTWYCNCVNFQLNNFVPCSSIADNRMKIIQYVHKSPAKNLKSIV